MNRLRQLRFEKGVKAVEVAETVGISREMLSLLENGRFLPSAPTAKKLATYYGVPVMDLMRDLGSGDKPDSKPGSGPNEPPDLPAAA